MIKEAWSLWRMEKSKSMAGEMEWRRKEAKASL
jgi:hypothetical protein